MRDDLDCRMLGSRYFYNKDITDLSRADHHSQLDSEL